MSSEEEEFAEDPAESEQDAEANTPADSPEDDIFGPSVTHNRAKPEFNPDSNPSLPARYEATGEVFSGGMGVVWKAIDTKLDRVVAVKRIHSEFLSKPERLRRFEKEAKAIVKLRHQNIVTIYDVDSDDAGPFIVMEWLDGGNLQDKLKKDGVLAPTEAAHVFSKIARGLDLVHDSKIIHRDIKPANILLDEHGEPVVVDFGLVRFNVDSEVSVETVTGAVLGTIKYIAPEVMDNAKSASHLSDIWSLGATLHQVVTQSSVLAMRERDIPLSIRDAILTALEKDPGKRFQKMSDFADALDSIGGGARSKVRRSGQTQDTTVLIAGQCDKCQAINPERNKHCQDCGQPLRNVCLNQECDEPVAVWVRCCGGCGTNQRQSLGAIASELNPLLDEIPELIEQHLYANAESKVELLLAAKHSLLTEFVEHGERLQQQVWSKQNEANARRKAVHKKVQKFVQARKFELATKELKNFPKQLWDATTIDLETQAKKQEHEHEQRIVSLSRQLADLRHQFQNGELFQKQTDEVVSRKLTAFKKFFENAGLEDRVQECRDLQDLTVEAFKELTQRSTDLMQLICRWPSYKECREAADELRQMPGALKSVATDSIKLVDQFAEVQERFVTAMTEEKQIIAEQGLLGLEKMLAELSETEHHGFAEQSKESATKLNEVRVGVKSAEMIIKKRRHAVYQSLRTDDFEDALAEFKESVEVLSGNTPGTVLEANVGFCDYEVELRTIRRRRAEFIAAKTPVVRKAEELQAEGELLKALSVLHGLPDDRQVRMTRLAIESRLKADRKEFEKFQLEAGAWIKSSRFTEALLLLDGLAMSLRKTRQCGNIRRVFRIIQTAHSKLSKFEEPRRLNKYVSQTLERFEKLRLERSRDPMYVALFAAAIERLSEFKQELKHRLQPPFSRPAAQDAQLYWADRLQTEVEIINSLGMKFKIVPPGVFLIGSPPDEQSRNDDELQGQVGISRPFLMASHPVTQGEWVEVMHKNPSAFANAVFGDSSRFPMENVNWFDACEFIDRLNDLHSIDENWRYRLPTEAEWEYSCRAGSTEPFSFGRRLNGTEAICDGNRPYGTAIIGPARENPVVVCSHKPNAFGLFDLHGQIWEWCQDSYLNRYEHFGEPWIDPVSAGSGDYRVVRGGSYRSAAGQCRSASRKRQHADLRNDRTGFRVVAEQLPA